MSLQSGYCSISVIPSVSERLPHIEGMEPNILTHALPGFNANNVYAMVWQSKQAETIWDIHRLWVAPKLRGKGLAKQMLQLIIEQANKDRVTLRLIVDPLDSRTRVTKLRSLYRSFGFTKIGIYKQSGRDIMEKNPACNN